MSAYAGSNIAVAFYGESTVSGGDNNLHIDNVSIDYIPVCLTPTGLTVSNLTAHTAQLSWISDASEWQICLNGDETNLITATTNPYTLTDLTPETVYTAKVRVNCSMELQNSWSDEISFMPTYRVVIGTGTGTNSYLPTNVSNKYSLTQQIYTVAELGEAGNIVSIDFRKNNNEGCVRNLDIYMVTTTKSSFTGSNDWIPVTSFNKVFSGTVNFANDNWTTITLDRAFSYDGTSNIAIMVDDNTGNVASTTPFLAFPAENQALHICARTTNYRPATANNYNGTVASTKNQIRIFKTDLAPICYPPTAVTASEIDHQGATLSWTENGEATSWIVAYKPSSEQTFTEVEVNENPYTLAALTKGTEYIVKVRPVCDDATENWSSSVSFTTLACVAISLNEQNNYVWTENFDEYTNVTTSETGVQPDCWEVIFEDVILTNATKPQVYCGYATSGSYSLRMKNRCVYAAPVLAEDVDVNALTMTFNLRQPKSVYRLQVGVINEDGEFELVKTINNVSSDMESVKVDFSGYEGNGNRIAFRNTLTKGSSIDYSINYIDDIVLGYASSCEIDALPYTENFDSYTTVSVGETGAQPDCWEVITEDVTLTKATKPQVYYGYAISGNYTLRMKNRCVYAMPALENINVRGMTMTFSLRQPNSKYRLQVGVVNDEGEFMLVKTLKCSSTSNMEAKTVDFSNYTGNGNRIAFRNTLVPGTGSSTSYLDYSINYIEDINLNYTVAAKNVANDGNVMGMNAALENIEVYPNPTKDYVNVECTTNNVQCSGIEVVDVYGKVVRTVVGANNYSPTQINVSRLAAGMYFVRVTTDKGVVTKPFMKK